ncbi:MAG: M23 family metallopeptidase [Beijerinckiaceae bacterium]|nr:M23 family metallopeptidase [Beijerinckiaceae bacterium]
MGTSSRNNADASRTSGARRFDRAGASLQLGLDPPLESDGAAHSELDRRRVSVRWLSGTILTGLAGAGLIGSAVYAALDPSVFMAEQPQIAVLERPTTRAEGAAARKGDRIFKSVDMIAARQTFRTPTTIRSGDREIVRQRTFTRVATNLAMGSTGFSSEVPAFNPLKLLAGGPSQTELVPEPDTVREEVDVSFTSHDLAPVHAFPETYSLSEEEIAAQLREFLRSAGRDSARTSLPIPPQLLLTRTSRAAIDPVGLSYANVGDTRFSTAFSSIEVRMVPENVTLIPRADAHHRDTEERVVVVRRSESLEDILTEAGANRDVIRRIAAALGTRRGQPAVTEGQRLRIMFADLDANGKPNTIARLSVFTDEREESTVALADSGDYVQLARTDAVQPLRRAPVDDDDDEDTGAMRLYNSFFETAIKQEIPRPIIEDLVRIFANDIDFQRSVSGGDSFVVFYEESEETEGRYELLYASITARGETYKYYRHHSTDDGVLDFYDEQGRSTRKFLIRKPIVAGQQRSGFGMRRHPIMGYTRMHTGVDWAAPRGTPIVSAGNGTVIKAARESGYGNRVEIQHANGYITTYNHMSGFARGMREGLRVQQGQVIGFLGSTGLSTGPHLHYEVIVNGNFVDPMRIRLARTRELNGRQLAEFRRERERIDELMQRAPAQQRFAARSN